MFRSVCSFAGQVTGKAVLYTVAISIAICGTSFVTYLGKTDPFVLFLAALASGVPTLLLMDRLYKPHPPEPISAIVLGLLMQLTAFLMGLSAARVAMLTPDISQWSIVVVVYQFGWLSGLLFTKGLDVIAMEMKEAMDSGWPRGNVVYEIAQDMKVHLSRLKRPGRNVLMILLHASQDIVWRLGYGGIEECPTWKEARTINCLLGLRLANVTRPLAQSLYSSQYCIEAVIHSSHGMVPFTFSVEQDHASFQFLKGLGTNDAFLFDYSWNAQQNSNTREAHFRFAPPGAPRPRWQRPLDVLRTFANRLRPFGRGRRSLFWAVSDRQPKGKCRSFVQLALHLHFSAELLNDPLHQYQPQSGPFMGDLAGLFTAEKLTK